MARHSRPILHPADLVASWQRSATPAELVQHWRRVADALEKPAETLGEAVPTYREMARIYRQCADALAISLEAANKEETPHG